MAESEAAMVDLECRLTIAVMRRCECSAYFIRRREALIPAVLERAERDGTDPVDLFAAYAQRVHALHESGPSLAALAPVPADTEEPLPCVCGSTLVRPYPNDTGPHSTTECPGSSPEEGSHE